MFFEGAKLLINKGLSNHFQVSHTLTLSALQPAASGYRFGATFVGPNMVSPSEAYPLLLADLEPSTGDLNANIVHAPTERTRCKFIAQIQQGRWQSTQITSDYKGDNFTVSNCH
jgi:mitochondrial import receptor subunit TOM40